MRKRGRYYVNVFLGRTETVLAGLHTYIIIDPGVTPTGGQIGNISIPTLFLRKQRSMETSLDRSN